MAIDLTERQELTAREKYEISVMIHYTMLEELFRCGEWGLGDVVFHGGTSLKVNWQSPRFSEDLDFMLEENEAHRLQYVIMRAKEKMSARLMAELPNSQFGIKDQKKRDGRLVRNTIRWSHPNRVGVVNVKLEFYLLPKEKLATYPAMVSIPDPDRETRTAIATPIVAGTRESIFTDKLVALAKRPFFKMRDIYDVWYIDGKLNDSGVRFDGQDLSEMLSMVGSLYNYSEEELCDGLNQGLEKIEDPNDSSSKQTFLSEMTNNLGRWIPHALHEGYSSSNTYENILDRTIVLMGEASQTLQGNYSNEIGGMQP